jgi:hypothetical protein
MRPGRELVGMLSIIQYGVLGYYAAMLTTVRSHPARRSKNEFTPEYGCSMHKPMIYVSDRY